VFCEAVFSRLLKSTGLIYGGVEAIGQDDLGGIASLFHTEWTEARFSGNALAGWHGGTAYIISSAKLLIHWISLWRSDGI
jgi:hypothetical protein